MIGDFVYIGLILVLVILLSSHWEDAPPRLRLLWIVPVLLAPLAVPELTFLATQPSTKGEQAWSVCAVSNLLVEGECHRSVRWLLIAASLVPALVIVVLIWSKFSPLSEVRWLFEKPWSGLGEDADTASSGESLARAAAFLLAGLVCIGLLGFSLAAGFHHSDRWFDYSATPAPLAKLPVKPAPGDQGTIVASTAVVEAIHSQGSVQKTALDGVAGKLDGLSGELQALTDQVHTIANGIPKDDRYLRALADIQKGIENIPSSFRDDSAVPAIGALRATLEGIDATLKDDKAEPVLGEIRKSLDAIASKIENNVDNSALAQIGLALGEVNSTLKEENSLPALSEILRTIQRIDTSINVTKPAPPSPPASPQGCFDPQFLADSDDHLQALRDETEALREKRYRVMRSHYVYFGQDEYILSKDDQNQITKFLSDPPSDAVLSIRGTADGRGPPDANETAAFARARTAALFVSQQGHTPPLVDLRWTVEPGPPADRPHNRFVLVQLLQACK
jgi:hypothetical protein